MAEIDGEQYAARKLGCEISADPLNPLDPIKKVCKSHHPDEDLSILDRAYRRAVIQHSAQRRKSGEPYIIHPLAVSQILADLGMGRSWWQPACCTTRWKTPTIRWIKPRRIGDTVAWFWSEAYPS